MTYRKRHIAPKIRNLKKVKKWYRRRMFWIGFGVLFILFFGGYMGLFFPGFQVSDIRVAGNETIAREEIQALVSSLCHKKFLSAGLLKASSRSIFLVNPEKIHKTILKEFPRISEASVERKLPYSLAVALKERGPFGVFCSEASEEAPCFLIDEAGIIFEKKGPSQGKLLTIISSEAKPVVLGERAVEEGMIRHISQVAYHLNNNFQIGVRKAIIGNPLVIETSEGWKAHFDPTADASVQITKMDLLLQEQISPEKRRSLQYIYLQYEDRAYYK